MQRVDQYEVSAKRTAAPRGELGEVVQVTMAPGGARTYRVELYREAPRPARRKRRPGLARGRLRTWAAKSLRAARRPGVAERTKYRRQRLVGNLDVPPPPVLVGDGHAVVLGPARQFCPCCHRPSKPAPPLTCTGSPH